MISEIDIPGFGKLTLAQQKKLSERIDDAGLEQSGTAGQKRYPFLDVARQDPNLGLAGLRIEIEKVLVEMAERTGIKTNQQGLRLLLRQLHQKSYIDLKELTILEDITTDLNNAVHGRNLDPVTFGYAWDNGLRVLNALETKLARLPLVS